MGKHAQTVLLTGGSSGLGASLANRLAGSGWQTYAGSRRGTLADGAAPSILPLQLDVTVEQECVAAIDRILSEHGALDTVICNAGINANAPAEELPLERAKAILETNFWGAVNVIRAALPHFRVRHQGTIVVVGSLAGIVSPPGEAYYAASKHAVRGFLESLQYEVSSFGIRVHLIEPGYIKTGLAEASPPAHGDIADYTIMRDQLSAHWARSIAGGMPVETAAQKIAEVLENPNAPFRTRIGKDAIWVPRWKTLFPVRSFFAIARRRFGLD